MQGHGNLPLRPWAVHAVAIVGAAVVFYTSDQQFMALFPPWVGVVAHPTVALLTYLGITQVQSQKQE